MTEPRVKEASNIYQWSQSTSGTTHTRNVVRVTGVSGTVLAVAAEEGLSYVLTTSGVSRWSNATTGTTVAATLIPNTAGATQLSTWSHGRRSSVTTLEYGGAALTSNGIIAWRTMSADTSPLVVSPASPTTIALPNATTYGSVLKMVATDAGITVLTSKGALLNVDQNWSTPWQVRSASGVADFSAWGFDATWAGGLWINSTGHVFQYQRIGGVWDGRGTPQVMLESSRHLSTPWAHAA